MRKRGFIPKSIWSDAARRSFAFSAALALFLVGGLSFSADQPSQSDGVRPAATAQVVNNRTSEMEQSSPPRINPDVPFSATRYPFLPSLIKNREPELCATVLKGARERFFSSDAKPNMTGHAQSEMTWLEWNKVEGGGIQYRLDLDLDGNGRIYPVIGRRCLMPRSFEGREFFVCPSLDSLNKAASDQRWLDEPCESYRDRASESPRNADDPVKWTPTALLAGKQGKEISTGNDFTDHRLFRWRSRYYFFDEPSSWNDRNITRQTTFRLHADGTVDPRCVVCLFPDEGSVRSFRRIPGISSFLKVISTIGDEGERCTYCSNHNEAANAAVDRAAYRPWAVSRATKDPADVLSGSYYRYDDRMKRFLEDWSLLEVWNRREYQTLLEHVQPAVAALEKYYGREFGLAKEAARNAAERVVEDIIAAWILVPEGYQPGHDLYTIRRPPLNQPIFDRDLEGLKEEIRQEKERPPDGSRDMKPYYRDASTLNSYDRQRPDIEISLAVADAVEWEEGMRLLLEAGADPNGNAPLMTAAHMNRPDTVRLLLSHGADPNQKTVKMDSQMNESQVKIAARTALMYAAENAGTAVMKLLLDAGASPDARDSDGNGIGHYLARNPRLTKAEKKMDIRELVRSTSGRRIGPCFDCDKAKSQVEKAVCGDEVLKMLDVEMSDAFSRWVRLAGDEARNDQRRWLKWRETSCTDNDKTSDTGCLQDQTRSRVRYLHNRLAEYEPKAEKPRD